MPEESMVVKKVSCSDSGQLMTFVELLQRGKPQPTITTAQAVIEPVGQFVSAQLTVGGLNLREMFASQPSIKVADVDDISCNAPRANSTGLQRS